MMDLMHRWTAADLQRFCADADDVRPQRYHMHAPWSRGERTYATNGHILVHVPRLAEVPENAKAAPDAENLLERTKTGEWLLVPETEMPPDVPCSWCEGSGKDPSYRRYKCSECKGKKTQPDYLARTVIGPATFANRYLALIRDWEIAPTDRVSAARILCGDAEGLLMPMKNPSFE